jgi:NAD(P)-dependent dehydrogenase (short-subunit alcohol dehydrogenase family)
MQADRRRLLSSAVAAAGLAAAPALSAAAPSARARFDGKVVAITGGSRGIGRAAALAFAREGAKVGFCARGEGDGRATERAIRDAGGDAAFFVADVGDDEQVRAFVDGTAQRYGGLHIAFNNAGITLPAQRLHEIALRDWDRVAATNTRGVFVAMRHQLPHLLRAGGGSIVITSSFHQVQTRPGFAAYAASKHALPGIAQAAAMDYGGDGIRVNVLAPGIVDTSLFRSTTGRDPEAVKRAAALVDGLKRIATAEEVAAAALWLASDEARYVTGTTLLVDGGVTAGV